MNYKVADGRTYPEAPNTPHRKLSGTTWVCLDISYSDSIRMLRWYRLNEVTLVKPVMPTANIVIEMTADMIGSFAKGKPGVDPAKCSGVDIRVVKPCTAITVWQPLTEWRLAA